jgi:serine/alanine racemase
LLVVSIHIDPFLDVNKDFSFWFINVFARCAVPFFFMTNGFFLKDKIYDNRKLGIYIGKIVRMYMLYTILYIPLILYNYKKVYPTSEYLIHFLKGFFVGGLYMQLWYFPAAIIAVLLLHLCLVTLKLNVRKVVAISFMLYIIGCMGNSYQSLIVSNVYMKKILDFYESYFSTTRNGIFMGFLFVTLGYVIYSVNVTISKKKLCVYTLVGFALVNIEAFLICFYLGDDGEFDMFLTLPLWIVFGFILLCSISLSDKYIGFGKYLRKLSVLIFGLHIWVKFYVHWILLHIMKEFLNSFTYWLVMTGLTVLVSVVIIRLSGYKYFSWLKLFYS